MIGNKLLDPNDACTEEKKLKRPSITSLKLNEKGETKPKPGSCCKK